MQYETLTDLLNNEAAAYDYFYALSPEMQTQLQQRRDIRKRRHAPFQNSMNISDGDAVVGHGHALILGAA